MATKKNIRDIEIKENNKISFEKRASKILNDITLSNDEKVTQMKAALQERPDGISPVATIVNTKKLLDTSDAPVSVKIAAVPLIQDKIKELKAHLDNVVDQIADAKYDDIVKALIAEGVLKEGETPRFVITDKAGHKICRTITTATKTDWDKDKLEEWQAYLLKHYNDDKFIPDAFKVHTVQTPTWFKNAYFKGEIPAAFEDKFGFVESTTNTLKSVTIKEK